MPRPPSYFKPQCLYVYNDPYVSTAQRISVSLFSKEMPQEQIG